MIKATGIVRRIDDLGRIVIPKETRRMLDIAEGDPMEIYVDDNGEIILHKYNPGCVICGEVHNDNLDVHGVAICRKCAATIANSMNAASSRK